jgi:hypothetical protein
MATTSTSPAQESEDDNSLWTQIEDILASTPAKYFKYLLSTCLCVTYLVYIMWGIWTGQAVFPAPPIVDFLIFIFCMTLVGYLEGLQVAILAVEHADPDLYKENYPRAYKLMSSCKQGNNVERFLVGRQFFTIFVMTLMAQVTSFPDISHLGINSIVWFIFIQTGLPGALVVTTIGSLQPQLLAAKDPWRFMDLYGSYSVLYLCYGLEASGICTHFAWMLIGILRSTVYTTNDPQASDKESTLQEKLIDALKYVVSFCVIMTYLSYLMWGIWTGQAILPVPTIGVFIVFCLSSIFLAHLEGLQVAILLAESKPLAAYKDSHPRGYALMKRATRGKNVRRFLIGRQAFVIFVVFLINQCTIFPDISRLNINSGVWFFFIQLGWPTALNVLCWAQLPTQILAAKDGYKFMDRFGPTLTLNVCLFTEMTGLAHFSWVVAAFSMATWFRVNPDNAPVAGSYKDVHQAADPHSPQTNTSLELSTA